MDSGALDSPVTLVIKAPNQKYEDQTISCFLNWTVERLKRHISNVYPSKPVSFSGDVQPDPSPNCILNNTHVFVLQLSKDQRLVYSGRLLQDHLQLRDVLRKVRAAALLSSACMCGKGCFQI